MREIVFRGKAADNGRRYLGDLIQSQKNTKIRLHGNGQSQGTPVNPETIGQYTGLKDKNGIKVFEGDICRDSDGETGIIMYKDFSFCFVARPNDGRGGLCFSLNMYNNASKTLEIIGNIHDNPELSKEI